MRCWHATSAMSVRSGIAVVSIAGLGVLAVGCATATEPSEPSVPSSRAAPSSTTEATTLPAPAPGERWLRLSPEQGTPGTKVSLDVACLDALGTVHSPVLDVGPLAGNPDGHQPWHQFGTATVHSDGAPGRYTVSATCGTGQVSATFTVIPR